MPTATTYAPPLPWLTGVLAATGAAAALARLGASVEGLIIAFTVAVLVVLTAIDIDRRLVPNRIVVPSAAVVLIAHIAAQPDRTGEWLAAAFGAAGVLLLASLVNPQGMGMGDVKLALLLGAALGANVVGAFLVASLAVIPAAAFIMLRKGAAGRKATVPFVPFLAFGAVLVALLAG